MAKVSMGWADTFKSLPMDKVGAEAAIGGVTGMGLNYASNSSSGESGGYLGSAVLGAGIGGAARGVLTKAAASKTDRLATEAAENVAAKAARNVDATPNNTDVKVGRLTGWLEESGKNLKENVSNGVAAVTGSAMAGRAVNSGMKAPGAVKDFAMESGRNLKENVSNGIAAATGSGLAGMSRGRAAAANFQGGIDSAANTTNNFFNQLATPSAFADPVAQAVRTPSTPNPFTKSYGGSFNNNPVSGHSNATIASASQYKNNQLYESQLGFNNESRPLYNRSGAPLSGNG